MARTKGSTSTRSAGSKTSGTRSNSAATRRSSSSGNSNGGGRRTSSSRSNDWSSGVIDLARERPIAAAAVAAGAAAAGLFMWSKRSQISNQLSNLSDQIGKWTENVGFGSLGDEFGDDTGGLTTGSTNMRSGRGRSATRGMSETGGGNATLGSVTGGAGTRSSASGRGRAQSAAATQE